MTDTNEPARVKDLLGRLGERIRGGDPTAVSRIWSSWSEIVGDQIATHAAPTSFRDGILRVRVDSPIWASELHYLTGEIQERVNALIGASSVEEVRVWTGTGKFTPLHAPDAAEGRSRSATDRRANRRRRTGRAFGDPGAGDGGKSAFERAFAAWQSKRTKGPS